MQQEQENYYLNKNEPTKSCLLTLHDIIITFNAEIKPCWKYRMPMFCINNKMFCYLWTDKKTNEPYIGFVNGNLIEHSKLIQAGRKKMKVLYINPNEDINIILINELLGLALEVQT